MTIANLIDAATESLALFKPAWGSKPLELPNTAFTKPGIKDTWASWRFLMAGGQQDTLSGATGSRRFGRAGLVLVEVYTPLGAGLKVPSDAAQIVLDAYEGKRTPSDVWFRNVRVIDEGEGNGGNKAWWCTQVAADFTFDTLK